MPKPKNGKTLTDKEQVFCLHYVQSWNATRAAIEAGYSKKTAAVIGSENLRKPKIQAEIQRVMDQVAMSAQEVLARFSAEGRVSMADLVEPYDIPILDKEGMLVGHRQSFRVKQGAFEKYGHLIKSISPTSAGDFKVELHDSQKARELIGRHRNMFKETNLNIDLSKLTDAQLERIATGEDPLKVLINA
jgi:phage terminase small subunit